MYKTRETIAKEISGKSEPQIVDYVDGICKYVDEITDELEVTKLNLELAIEGGADIQEEFDDFKSGHKKLESDYKKLEGDYKRIENELIELKKKNSNQGENLTILQKDHFETGPEKDPLKDAKPGTSQTKSTGQTQGTNEATNDGKPGRSSTEGQQDAEKATGADSKPGNQGTAKGNDGKVEQPPKKSNRKPPKRDPAAAKASFENLPTFHTFMDIDKALMELQILYPGRRIEFAFEDKPREIVHRIPENCTKEIRHRPIFKIYRPDGTYITVGIEDEYLKRGIPVGADFMASLFYNRVIMCQPLNRQNTSLLDFGCKTTLSKISEWNISFSREFLKPVSDYLLKLLFKEYTIQQMDESRWICVEFKKKNKEGYAFIIGSSELGETDENGKTKPAIRCIKIQEGRQCDFLVPYLTGKHHILDVDGYSGYVALTKNPLLDVELSGCWVHKRRGHIHAFDVLPADTRKDVELLKTTPEWLFLAAYGSIFHYDTPAKRWDREHRLMARQLLVKPFVDFILESEGMLRNILSLTAADVNEDEETVEEEDKKHRVLSKIEEIYDMMRKTGVLSEDAIEGNDLDAVIKKKKSDVEKTIAYLKERREAIFAQLDPTTVSNHLRKAIGYKMNRTSDFMLFLIDPDIPIDNNSSERIARKIAAGRVNYFCTRTVYGNEALESQFTLALTAQANNVNPFIYYVYVLKTVSKYKRDHFMKEKDNNFSDEFLATLTPWSKEFKEFAEKETDHIYYGFLTENQVPTFQLKKRSQEAINALHNTKASGAMPNAEILDALNSTGGTNSLHDTEDSDSLLDTPDTSSLHNTMGNDTPTNTESTDLTNDTEDTDVICITEDAGSTRKPMTLDELLNVANESIADPNAIQHSQPAACRYPGEPVLKVSSKEVAQRQKARAP